LGWVTFRPGSKLAKKWEVTFKKSTSKIVVFLVVGSVKLGWENSYFFWYFLRNFFILIFFYGLDLGELLIQLEAFKFGLI
jgi:hypothetical protein